ncbi:hypothetical protein BKA62DRAFT_719423 [Auriculariales sp. MPI-PUGE-AT-0066]|nr:hypothetical protein BKA62DRAFT_719423 [Auriculariales sp. MPI-PUGE-AT-0066]
MYSSRPTSLSKDVEKSASKPLSATMGEQHSDIAQTIEQLPQVRSAFRAMQHSAVTCELALHELMLLCTSDFTAPLSLSAFDKLRNTQRELVSHLSQHRYHEVKLRAWLAHMQAMIDSGVVRDKETKRRVTWLFGLGLRRNIQRCGRLASMTRVGVDPQAHGLQSDSD